MKLFLEDLILLNLTGYIGSSLLGRLLERFGSTRAIVNAGRRELMSVVGIGPIAAKAISDIRETDRAEEEKEKAKKLGIKVLPYTHQDYPEQIKNIFDY